MDIEYLLWLQGVREAAGPVVEAIMNLISALCNGTGIAVVPCVLYWLLDKDAGMFVMVNLGIGNNLNQLIKDSACIYRPWIRDSRIIPSAGALGHATGYSFPSGHTQAAGSVFGSIAWRYRAKRWLAAICVIITLLVGFSRTFLGVHAPQDVAAALIEAVLVIWLSQRFVAWARRKTTKDTTVLCLGLATLAIILLYTEIKPYPMDYARGMLLVDPAAMKLDAYSNAGILGGVTAGWFLEQRYVRFSTDCSHAQKLVRLVVCALMMGLSVGLGQLVGLVFGHGIAYAVAKGLFPAFIGVFVGPAVSASFERRFDPSGTRPSRESG